MRKIWIITVLTLVVVALVLVSCGQWRDKAQKQPANLGAGGDDPGDSGGSRGISLLKSLETPTELPYEISHLPKDSTGLDLDDIVGSSDVLYNPENYATPPKSWVARVPEDFFSVRGLFKVSNGEFRNTTSTVYNRIIIELGYESDGEFHRAILAELELVEKIVPISLNVDEDNLSEFQRAYDSLRDFYLVGRELPENWPKVSVHEDRAENWLR